MKIFREVKGIPEPEEAGKEQQAGEAGREGGRAQMRAAEKPQAESDPAERPQPNEAAAGDSTPGSELVEPRLDGAESESAEVSEGDEQKG